MYTILHIKPVIHSINVSGLTIAQHEILDFNPLLSDVHCAMTFDLLSKTEKTTYEKLSGIVLKIWNLLKILTTRH